MREKIQANDTHEACYGVVLGNTGIPERGRLQQYAKEMNLGLGLKTLNPKSWKILMRNDFS